MDLVTVFVILTIVVYFIWSYSRKPLPTRPLPPGPPRMPLLGNLLTFDISDLQRGNYKLAKQYGRIFYTKVGPMGIVVLNEPKLIKDVLSRDEFIPRPQFWPVEQRSIVNGNSTGIVFAEGEQWKQHRRFILQTFRDFGVGKFMMEEKIIDEAQHLLKYLENTNGEAFDNKVPLSVTVANVIGSVLMGRRYEADDPAFQHFLWCVKENFEINWKGTMLAVLPVTRHFLPPIHQKYKDFLGVIHSMRNFFLGTIDEHVENWVAGREGDFIESYISAVKEGNHDTFAINQVPLLLEDLFEAGFETTTTTLRWAMLMMAMNQNVQRKVQEELDTNVPANTVPKPSNKFPLPYTEATLMEVHRYGSIVPMGVNHSCREDTTIEGYHIPKDSWVQANLYFLHHNDEWWDQPETFNPQRFLTDNNEVVSSEYLMPFAVGKRRCLGEALARAEVFIIFTAVLQRFTVTLPDGVKVEDMDLRPMPGITADTRPHKLCFISRQSVLN